LISNNVHEGETAGLTMLQFCTWVSIVSVILLSATLLLISETVFSYVLGDAWGDVGIYVTILAPWMVTAFFNIPGVSFFTVMKFSRLLLLYDISLFLLRILVFFVASYFLLDIAEFLLIFSMVGFVFNYWLIVYSYACARRVGEKALLRC
jgi:lipopolysaccharide exporter